MTDSPAPESFDEARQQLSAFLRKNGYSENLLWADRGDLVWNKRRLWVHDYPAALEHARQQYADGIRTGLGVNLQAFAFAEGATLCAVITPIDDDCAQRHLIPPRGLKLSALKNMKNARRIRNRLIWSLLALFYKDSSRLFLTDHLECS